MESTLTCFNMKDYSQVRLYNGCVTTNGVAIDLNVAWTPSGLGNALKRRSWNNDNTTSTAQELRA